MSHHRASPHPPWRRLLWVAVALLLVTNQSAFRAGTPAASAARAVACCGCAPGHCHCGHAHRAVARHCTPTGGSCLCAATPVSHEVAGLIHADWPPALLTAPVAGAVAPSGPRLANGRADLEGWDAPPALPPPQVG